MEAHCSTLSLDVIYKSVALFIHFVGDISIATKANFYCSSLIALEKMVVNQVLELLLCLDEGAASMLLYWVLQDLDPTMMKE